MPSTGMFSERWMDSSLIALSEYPKVPRCHQFHTANPVYLAVPILKLARARRIKILPLSALKQEDFLSKKLLDSRSRGRCKICACEFVWYCLPCLRSTKRLRSSCRATELCCD